MQYCGTGNQKRALLNTRLKEKTTAASSSSDGGSTGGSSAPQGSAKTNTALAKEALEAQRQREMQARADLATAKADLRALEKQFDEAPAVDKTAMADKIETAKEEYEKAQQAIVNIKMKGLEDTVEELTLLLADVVADVAKPWQSSACGKDGKGTHCDDALWGAAREQWSNPFDRYNSDMAEVGHWVASGDLEGDGLVDVVVHHDGSGRFLYFRRLTGCVRMCPAQDTAKGGPFDCFHSGTTPQSAVRWLPA